MTGSAYDEDGVAQRYSEHRHDPRSSPNRTMEEPAFLQAVGDVTDLAVLDLGCGDAGFGRTALEAGCRSYLGVDDSQSMLDQARQELAGTSARLHRSPLEELDLDPAAFDLVVSRMAFHYVADLDALLADCHRWLTPSGRLVITVVHPVLTSPLNPPVSRTPRTDWTVDDYFSPGPRRRTWMGMEVTWQHRTLEAHVAALTANGFTLTDLRECAPDPTRFPGPDDPELARRRRVPLFLLLAAVKAHG